MPAAINLDRNIVRVVVPKIGPICTIFLLGYTLQNGAYFPLGYNCRIIIVVTVIITVIITPVIIVIVVIGCNRFCTHRQLKGNRLGRVTAKQMGYFHHRIVSGDHRRGLPGAYRNPGINSPTIMMYSNRCIIDANPEFFMHLSLPTKPPIRAGIGMTFLSISQNGQPGIFR